MPVNLDDIKKLSKEEKLRIINELWESIDKNTIDEALESEENQILRERMAEYEKGNMTFHSWEDIKKEIEEKLRQQRCEK